MAHESRLPSVWGGKDGDPFALLRREVDDLFRDFSRGFKAPAWVGGTSAFSPDINVSETDGELRITADLPGLSEKDVEVTLTGRTLTVRGEKKTEHEDKSDDKGRVFHRVERSYGSFQRTMTLPFDLDPSQVTAEFKSGVLTVALPKPAETATQAKRIEIKPAG